VRLVEIGIKELQNLVNKSADISLNTFDKAKKAIEEGKASEAREEVKKNVEELRKLREEIDELALEIIARYQPLASELRFVKASMDLGYAFMRFGRYSYDALAAFARAQSLNVKCEPQYYSKLAPIVERMMSDAITSLKKRDALLALKVISKDDEVDEIYHNALIEIMKGYKNVPCAVVEALSLKFLERAADHSAHVAAQTVFIVEGRYPE